MTLDEDIQKIKSDVEKLCHAPLSVSRPFLYLITLLNLAIGAKTCYNTEIIYDKIPKDRQFQAQNVLGNEALETFYEINGRKVYITVDGKPVEHYFAKPAKSEGQH